MIPTEDFTDATLAIDDTYGDDVRGGDGGDGCLSIDNRSEREKLIKSQRSKNRHSSEKK